MESFYFPFTEIKQSLALFSIISIAPIFYIFKKRINKFLVPIPILFLSFIDNSLLIFQEKNTSKLNANFFCSYNIITTILNDFSLEIEYNKSEVFHFSRATKYHNLQLLDLSPLRGLMLILKKL